MNHGPRHVKYYRLQDISNTNFLWNTNLCVNNSKYGQGTKLYYCI